MAQIEGSNQPQGSKNRVESVAIVGAGGNSGKYIAEALLGTGKHAVTAITRADSNAKLPDGVQVKQIDYDNQSSIVEALQGQDALIITLPVMTPPEIETKLIEAAAEANVPWVFPNEWGFDVTNESLWNDIFGHNVKKPIREHVEKLGKSAWTGVSTSLWYEWSLAMPFGYGFDFANRAVTLYDDGETRINTSTWPQVGRTMASLLSLKIHPDGEGDNSLCLDRFRNDFVYVSSFTVSQKDMLESVLRVTQTSLDDWKVTKEPVKDRYAAGMEQMKSGDRMGFVKVLYARLFYPDDSGNVEKTKGLHNDVLGLPKEDLDEYTEAAIERARVMNSDPSQ